jgi:PIN domain nuclease of toxin-antitoxin system
MLFTTEIPSIGSIAQAITEGMAAVGRDDAFEEYSVRLVWKQQ